MDGASGTMPPPGPTSDASQRSPGNLGSATRPNDPVGDLLMRIATGDPAALVELHDLTSDDVLRTARALLVDPHHAEDATQEVYLQLWLSAAQTYDPVRGSGISFVKALTRRRAIDRIRTVEATRRRDTRWVNPSNEWDVETTISRIQIQTALRSLGDLAHTIVAVYFYGQTYREIADDLGVPFVTVKNRHHKALAELRQLISPET